MAKLNKFAKEKDKAILVAIVNCQLLLCAEVINLKTLVLDRLFVATNTNITVNHNFFVQR